MTTNIKWALGCLLFVMVSACASKKVFVNVGKCERFDGHVPYIVECDPIDKDVIDQIRHE